MTVATCDENRTCKLHTVIGYINLVCLKYELMSVVYGFPGHGSRLVMVSGGRSTGRYGDGGDGDGRQWGMGEMVSLFSNSSIIFIILQ